MTVVTLEVEAKEAEEEEEVVLDVNNSENAGDVGRDFPDPFYDPTTGELMQEPVVNPAGDSYEKSTLPDDQGSVTYYPNRALQSIIQREVERADNSWKGSVRRLDEALQSGWGRLLEKSAFRTEYRPLPDGFYCPIMCELLTDPVISQEGNSYEREAIEHWILANGFSPITRTPLTVEELRENNALYELIQKEKGRNSESVHPSIRRWRESGDATSRRPQAERASDQQQQQSQTPPPPSAPPARMNYPTTENELRARRTTENENRVRRRSNQCYTGFFVLIFTILVIILALPFWTAIVIVANMLLVSAICRK